LEIDWLKYFWIYSPIQKRLVIGSLIYWLILKHLGSEKPMGLLKLKKKSHLAKTMLMGLPKYF